MDIEVKGANVMLRHDRYAMKQPVKVTTPDGSSFIAQSENVSRSGMALALEGPVMENGQFLELHTESLGTLAGRVTRIYGGGLALQFEDVLTRDPSSASPERKLNQLA
ncbi:MAG: PilZ domain-containing protein [Rhodospirillales bacterium]|nr:PilZ domain-containing protein [Rhodospirillales bacterium]